MIKLVGQLSLASMKNVAFIYAKLWQFIALENGRKRKGPIVISRTFKDFISQKSAETLYYFQFELQQSVVFLAFLVCNVSCHSLSHYTLHYTHFCKYFKVVLGPLSSIRARAISYSSFYVLQKCSSDLRYTNHLGFLLENFWNESWKPCN